ncbi:hypothetical protein B0T14DRAFT_80048 [Immersiella caudata]|uniref:Zn(2)-C6 fungal-type domain-containing protein n=1 Tax=Immersiella caudata TaxID=314043 RepID=A0AA39XHI1_9PEZI|nr:hypothetical protein B0T14DRAFT_80048 [Immersiella caudata]
MADDPRGGRGYPPRENPHDYPPPPEEEDRRAHQQPPPAPNMTLPSFRYPPSGQGYAPEQRYQDAGYPADPRYPPDSRYDSRANWSESPTNQNGYSAPPPGRYDPPPPPPPQPTGDRSRYDRPPEGRGYDRYAERPPYPDSYYAAPPPPPAARGGGYAPPDPYYRYQQPGPYPGYHDYQRGGPNAPPTAAAQPQQAAPRQRTSIACRYCRKRKIRCSGYANTTNGKCTNCDKLRIECIFQPVSSNSSTAFVPVSAVPGGVPPGTPLYGAYGQPLHPTAGQSQQGPPQQGGQPRPYPPPPSSDYAPSLHSPTSQYPQYDDRDRDPTRRRTRPPEEEHAMRLPPPNHPVDGDHRRRSPASTRSDGTPPTSYHPYPQGGYDQDRTPTPHRNSPGGPPPVTAPQPQLQPLSQSFGASRNPMSLNVLVGPDTGNRGSGMDIDTSMKSKLDSRRS